MKRRMKNFPTLLTYTLLIPVISFWTTPSIAANVPTKKLEYFSQSEYPSHIDWAVIRVAQSESGKTKAEIAREAYDQDDAGPKENWFGCQPEASDNNTETEPVSDNCDPESPNNDDS